MPEMCECCGKRRIKVLTVRSYLGSGRWCRTCALAWGIQPEIWKAAWTKSVGQRVNDQSITKLCS